MLEAVFLGDGGVRLSGVVFVKLEAIGLEPLGDAGELEDLPLLRHAQGA